MMEIPVMEHVEFSDTQCYFPGNALRLLCISANKNPAIETGRLTEYPNHTVLLFLSHF